jgi:hypothetical protein
VTRFFIIFNTAVVAILAVQIWSLGRVARRTVTPLSRSLASLLAVAPLAWEFVLAGLLLVLYPSMTGGLGWRGTFGFIPDLTLVIVAVSALWLLTGVARIARFVEVTLVSRHQARAGINADLTTRTTGFGR